MDYSELNVPMSLTPQTMVGLQARYDFNAAENISGNCL